MLKARISTLSKKANGESHSSIELIRETSGDILLIAHINKATQSAEMIPIYIHSMGMSFEDLSDVIIV